MNTHGRRDGPAYRTCAAGADLLIHESFQSPAVYARATGLPLETALKLTKLGHTSPTRWAGSSSSPRRGWGRSGTST
jgi:hypothetical protein